MKNPIRILYLEDDPTDILLVRNLLKSDFATIQTCDHRQAFEFALKEPWDVILLDLHLPDMKPEEAIAIARRLQPETPAIIFTGSLSDINASIACRGGAVDYILKDRLERLKMAVENAHHTRQMRLQMTRDQRLEILGGYVAGLIHDYRGILQVFTMGASLLRDRINPDDARILDRMESAAKRAIEMGDQVMAFARGTNGSAFKSVSAQYILGEIENLIRGIFPANISIHVKTEIGTSPMQCDAVQIAQALQNLVLNARDIMTPKGGTLILHAQNVQNAKSVPGPWVELSVSDSGEGIPA